MASMTGGGERGGGGERAVGDEFYDDFFRRNDLAIRLAFSALRLGRVALPSHCFSAAPSALSARSPTLTR